MLIVPGHLQMLFELVLVPLCAGMSRKYSESRSQANKIRSYNQVCLVREFRESSS
jgi:hypothetical protein